MPNPVTFTPEQEHHIVQQFTAGAGALGLGKQFGTTSKPVVRVLVKHGVWVPDRRFQGQYSDQTKRSMVADYEAGATIMALAKEHGCTTGTIRSILRTKKVVLRGQAPPIPIDPTVEPRLRELRAKGLPLRQVAKELGLPTYRISRWARLMGIAEYSKQTGPDNPTWLGGRILKRGGYWYAWVAADDPLSVMANSQGYVPEHRLVMARSLNRPLTRQESVHHINGDRADNRLENLQLRKGNHGKGVVVACLDCGSHNVGTVSLAG